MNAKPLYLKNDAYQQSFFPIVYYRRYDGNALPTVLRHQACALLDQKHFVHRYLIYQLKG
jgi:hypothetical protein